MRVADYRVLGLLPLQDHRPLPPEDRLTLAGGRVVGKDEFGRPLISGHEGTTDSQQTFGDVLGTFFIGSAGSAKRKMGTWYLSAGAFVTTRASKKSKKDKKSKTRTRTRTQGPFQFGIFPGEEKGKSKTRTRTVPVLPIGASNFGADIRFKETFVSIPSGFGNVPKGTPMAVMPTTSESAQELLGLPILGNNLVAVNNAGDPELATNVYDLTKEDDLDEERKARLHTFWRILQVVKGCSTGANNALAWNFTTGGQDKYDGRGLVVDTGGGPSAGSPKTPDPGTAPESQGDGSFGKSQVGAVTFVQDYNRKLRDRVRAAQSGGSDGQFGGATAGRTRPRGPGPGTGTRGGPDIGGPVSQGIVDLPPQPTQSALVAASLSTRSGGPIEVGDNSDHHRIGMTKDGIPINAAHIHTSALFKDSVGDGPLAFESEAWEDPTMGGPFVTPVHLRWDEATPHSWKCGTGPGQWRWEAETFIYVPEDKTSPPRVDPRTTPPPRLTDGPTDSPKPKECQTVPGGAESSTYARPRVDVALDSGTGHGAQTGTSFDGWYEDGWTIGHEPNDLTFDGWDDGDGDADWSDGGPADGGVGERGTGDADSDGEEGSGGNVSGDTGNPDSTGVDGHPRLDTGGSVARGGTDGGVGTTGTRGGAHEPTRERQKEGGGSGNDSVADSGRTTQGKLAPQSPIGSGSNTPIGNYTVYGGGNMNPGVLLALRAERSVDQFGRPANIPPPRVGDGTTKRASRMGGVTQRTPTMPMVLRIAGGIQYQAFATAFGQVDLTRGGWIQNELEPQVRSAPSAVHVAIAKGNGTWDSLQADPGADALDGGIVLLPGNGNRPEIVRDLLDGIYNLTEGDPVRQGPGSLETVARSFLPGGLTELYFATPTDGKDSMVQGAGGVKLEHTADGLRFVALSATTGLEAPQESTFGLAGWDITSDVAITGDLTVTGSFPGGSDRVSRLHRSTGTPVGNIGSGEDTLKTFLMAADAMDSDNDAIRIRAAGTHGNSSDTITIKLYFGGTVIGSFSSNAGSASGWTIDAMVTRRGATAQISDASTLVSTAFGFSGTVGSTGPAETHSGTIDIKVTGENDTDTTSNVALCHNLTVELIPA